MNDAGKGPQHESDVVRVSILGRATRKALILRSLQQKRCA